MLSSHAEPALLCDSVLACAIGEDVKGGASRNKGRDHRDPLFTTFKTSKKRRKNVSQMLTRCSTSAGKSSAAENK